MNTLSIIARLTRDPESKFTPNGKQITNFGIAYDVGFGDHKHACFIDCKLWGDRGQNFVKYVKKGHQVALTCSLDMDSWEDKATGQNLDVRNFTLLNNKRDGEQEEKPQRQQAKPAREYDEFRDGPMNKQAAADGMGDDDIPF
jgi:single-strand DNA-binding protein